MGNCSNCCTSPYLELTILINNSLNLITTFIGVIFINWEHGGAKGLILYIFLLVLSAIIEIFLFFILLWRKKNLLQKNNSKIINFGFIGMITSITILIIFCIAEIIIKLNFDEKDYPCKNYKNASISFFRILDAIEEQQEKENLCETLDKNYYTKTINKIEVIILYLNSSIVELLSIIDACLWNYFLKKIKEKLDKSKIQNDNIYGRNYVEERVQYPYMGKNGFKNKNIVKNNINNIYFQQNSNQIVFQKNIQINNLSKNNIINDTDYKDSIFHKDKSENSLYLKPSTFNTFKIINKNIYK